MNSSDARSGAGGRFRRFIGVATVAGVAGAMGVLGSWLAPPSARAGSRDIEVLFVRVDDGTDAAATGCAATVRTTLRSAAGETVHLVSLPRETLMTRLEVASLDGFVAWPRERLARAVTARQAAELDALVMLDCRPGEQRLDLVVLAGTSRVATAEPQRLSIRHTEITTAVARITGSVAAGWQQTDFLP